MNQAKRYSPEVRERAVRLLFEHEKDYRSRWAATVSIASKIGCTPETLRGWVRRVEIDTGRRDGWTSEDRVMQVARSWAPEQASAAPRLIPLLPNAGNRRCAHIKKRNWYGERRNCGMRFTTLDNTFA